MSSQTACAVFRGELSFAEVQLYNLCHVQDHGDSWYIPGAAGCPPGSPSVLGNLNMSDSKATIPLKRFLLLEQCPTAWKEMDLYVFRDESVVFYVGQSHFAFARVWEHLIGGFHGHSMMGRFVWCNWPKSMKFTIELLSSQSEEFGVVGNELSASERLLIQRWSPCFNISQNNQPIPLPDSYLPPNVPFRRRRSLNMLIHEAERAVQAEDAQLWLKNMDV
jgi:hypothetical protein